MSNKCPEGTCEYMAYDKTLSNLRKENAAQVETIKRLIELVESSREEGVKDALDHCHQGFTIIDFEKSEAKQKLDQILEGEVTE